MTDVISYADLFESLHIPIDGYRWEIEAIGKWLVSHNFNPLEVTMINVSTIHMSRRFEVDLGWSNWIIAPMSIVDI